MYKEGKMWKYTSGRFDNFDSANTHKTKIREKGHKDAFVVIFQAHEIMGEGFEEI